MNNRLMAFLSIGSVLGFATYAIHSSVIGPPASSFLSFSMPTSEEPCDPAIAPQVTVLQAGQPSTVAPPGARVNVALNFLANAPLPEGDSLLVSLVDERHKPVAQVRSNLNNKLLFLPTSLWSGPVSIILTTTIPNVSDGTYHYLLELDGSGGSANLRPGPGVLRDNPCRYEIGKLVVRASAAAPGLLPPPSLDLSNYEMTFDDEFSSLSISDLAVNDGSTWYSKNEACCMMTSDGTKTAMSGKSDQRNPFSLLPGGGLNIRLQRASNLWTSGVLTSVDSHGRGFSQMYGYFEMKARFPPGENTWPAFWLLNTASKSNGAPAGEIDIVEYIANSRFSDYISTTLHDWSNHSKAQPMSHYRVPKPSNSFHTYGMLWTEKTMTFYFDRSVTFQAPTPSIMKQPYYLIVDLGIGGGWPTKATPAGNDMQIQYIRAYKQK
ncbi:MAG: glycoside hydrolase family 16 protein [Terracidiphilus sp.]